MRWAITRIKNNRLKIFFIFLFTRGKWLVDMLKDVAIHDSIFWSHFLFLNWSSNIKYPNP